MDDQKNNNLTRFDIEGQRDDSRMRYSTARSPFTPKPEQMALKPAISGNVINGLGEPDHRRPSHIYWYEPEKIPHGEMQKWFYTQNPDPRMDAARERRAKIMALPFSEVAEERDDRPASQLSAAVKEAARKESAELVGITRLDPSWTYEDSDLNSPWLVVIGVAMDWDVMQTAPEMPSAVEVIDQYGRAQKVAKGLTNWIRERGWNAEPYAGPWAGSLNLVPAALACGFGELGKHGSIINRELGSCFRLAAVGTDMPLISDEEDDIAVDEFCINCRLCEDACPPRAIHPAKRMVRGDIKWYVDFDACLPYFNENSGCAICVSVCPWARPGVAPKLAEKMLKKRDN